MKQKSKTIIVYTAAIIAFLTGIGLCIGGFFVPPTGEISGTVLTATGEFLTFFSAVFGISEFTKVQIARIDRATRQKLMDADDEE